MMYAISISKYQEIGAIKYHYCIMLSIMFLFLLLKLFSSKNIKSLDQRLVQVISMTEKQNYKEVTLL